MKKKMFDNGPEWQLVDAVVMIATIKCGTCNVEEHINEEDALEGMREFYENGWMATPTHIYCPKCAIPFKKMLDAEKSKSK